MKVDKLNEAKAKVTDKKKKASAFQKIADKIKAMPKGQRKKFVDDEMIEIFAEQDIYFEE